MARSTVAPLGSEVVVVEFMDRILPGMDKEMTGLFQRVLEKQGMTFHFNTKAGEAKLVLGCDQPDPAAANVTWVNPTDGSQMVWIPRGKFLRGTAYEPTECDGFSLARHPVTGGLSPAWPTHRTAKPWPPAA